MNDRATKRLIASTSGFVNKDQIPERVLLVNEAGENIDTRTAAELNSQYGPLPTYFMPAPNGTNDTSAMDAVIAAAQAASPYRWQIAMRAGTYKRTTPLALTVGYTRLVGAGMEQTILSFSGSSGYAIDVSTATPSFADFTIDGTSATGSAGAFRLNGNIKNVKCEDVAFKNFNTSVAAVSLLGASQNQFDHCYWYGNFRNVALNDSGAYAPNENSFNGCNLGNTVGATGAAVTITNGEANTLNDCLIQSVDNIIAVHITNSAGATGIGARGNRIVGCYFEENGNSQLSSRGIYVQGASGRVITGTIIRDNKFFQSYQDNPSRQIELIYTDSTTIDGNYANLGSPHIITYDGGNNTNVLVGDNAFTGIQQLGRSDRPVGLWLSGALNERVTAPDSSGLSATGDTFIAMMIRPATWTPDADHGLVVKDDATNRSWQLRLLTTGRLFFTWWESGGTLRQAESTASVALVTLGWVAVSLDVNNGASGCDVRFWTAPFVGERVPTNLVQLGSTVTQGFTTSIRDTTASIDISGNSAVITQRPFTVFDFLMVSGLTATGTAVASPSFRSAPGTPRVRDAQGNIWTINGSAWAWDT